LPFAAYIGILIENLDASGLRPDRAFRGSALSRSGPAFGVAAPHPSNPLREKRQALFFSIKIYP
jgi:hypothetical protein